MNKISFRIFLLLSVGVNAQNNTIDSLKQVLKKELTPSQSITIYRTIGYEFLSSQIYLDSSLYYYQKAFKVAQDSKLDEEQAQTLFQIARSYGISENWSKTIEYFQKSMEYSERFENYSGWTAANNNIGKVLIEQGEYSKAKFRYLESLEIADKHQIKYNKTSAYTNLAEIYLREKEYALSLQYVNQSKELNVKLGRVSHWLYYVSARLNVALKRDRLAEEEALIAHEIAENKGDLEYTYLTAILLSEINEKKSNFEQATVYSKKALRFNDSIVKSRERNQIEKMELQLQLNEQETRVQALAQKNKYLYIIYAMTAIGVLLLIVLIFRQLKISRMTKNMHEIQNKLIKNELDKRLAK